MAASGASELGVLVDEVVLDDRPDVAFGGLVRDPTLRSDRGGTSVVGRDDESYVAFEAVDESP